MENKKTWNELMSELQKPFNYSDIKFRIQQAPKTDSNEAEAMVLAYVSNRAIQNRFDDVFGINNWKNEFKEWHENKMNINPSELITICDATNYKTEKQVALSFLNDHLTLSQLCGISVWDDEKKQWITKWDGADGTNFEETKGGLSDSMKRAAYHWGVGRYLYDLPAQTAKIKRANKYGNWYISETPKLPEWAYETNLLKPNHVKTIEKKIEKKQITIEKVCAKYLKQELRDLTIEEFNEALKLLDKVPDKEA